MTKSRRRWYIHALLQRLYNWLLLFFLVFLAVVDWDRTLANFGF